MYLPSNFRQASSIRVGSHNNYLAFIHICIYHFIAMNVKIEYTNGILCKLFLVNLASNVRDYDIIPTLECELNLMVTIKCWKSKN